MANLVYTRCHIFKDDVGETIRQTVHTAFRYAIGNRGNYSIIKKRTAMKINQSTILFISLLFLLSSCKKENEQTGMDFLQKEWKVQSVNKSMVPKDNLRKDAYILKFFNDYFVLHTSVNYAEGKYKIVSEGHIVIDDDLDWTMVYNGSDYQRNFDDRLQYVFNGAMTYSYTKNKLIFRGERNNEIIFIKR